MAEPIDIASAIGTWVAVGLAVLALVAIVVPLLVWRASKSARSRAINALDEGLAESFGFVDRGLWAGKNSKIFRRVRAPILVGEPRLPVQNPSTKVLVLDRQMRQPSEQSAAWVQFASLLQGYHLSFRAGDNLDVKSGRAWLPVKKTWILVVGLLGRYDRGRIRQIDCQTSPGPNKHTSSTWKKFRAGRETGRAACTRSQRAP